MDLSELSDFHQCLFLITSKLDPKLQTRFPRDLQLKLGTKFHLIDLDCWESVEVVWIVNICENLVIMIQSCFEYFLSLAFWPSHNFWLVVIRQHSNSKNISCWYQVWTLHKNRFTTGWPANKELCSSYSNQKLFKINARFNCSDLFV